MSERPAAPSKARRHAPGLQTQTLTCPRWGGAPQKGRAADRGGTRALGVHSVWLSPVPLGPAPLAAASLQVPPGTSLQSSFCELCWLPGPPRGSRSTRRLLCLGAWCFHAHLVAAVLTEHLEQLRRPSPPWPHRATLSRRRPSLSAAVRPSGCRGGDEAEAARSMEPHLPTGLPSPGPEPRAPGHCDLTSVTGPLGVPPAQPRRTHGALQEGRECRAPAGQAGVSPGAPHSRNPGQAVLGPPWWTLSCLRSSGRAQPPGTSRCSAVHSRGPPSPSELPGGPAAGLLPRLARSAPRFVSVFRDHGLGSVHTSGPQQAAALSPLLRGWLFTTDPATGCLPAPPGGAAPPQGRTC